MSLYKKNKSVSSQMKNARIAGITFVSVFVMLASPYAVLFKSHTSEKNHWKPKSLHIKNFEPPKSLPIEIHYPLTPLPPQLWVSTNPTVGRLGNQLFIAASSHGIAKRRGAMWCLETLGLLETAVQWIEAPVPCPSNAGQFVTLTEAGRHATYTQTLVDDQRESNITVGGYLQSFKYFANHPEVPFKLKTAEWGRQWVSERKINAGIHIRRGDYITDGYHVDLLPPLEFYAAAIQHLKALALEDLVFFVSSDDLPWVRSQAIFSGMIITEEGRSPEEDMSILAACRHMILSAGTFSWWSAYLSEYRDSQSFKIYYSEPTKEWESGRRVPTDHYPPWWIGLNKNDIRATNDMQAVRQKCPITWVSSYFSIPSKRGHNQYMSWIDNLFSMRMCLVLFTDNQEVEDKAMASPAKPLVVRVDLKDEAMNRLNMSSEFWERQFVMDPEREIHQGYQLYWVWALKSYFLSEAMQLESKTEFHSEFFMWVDAGLMRDQSYNNMDIRSVNPDMNQHQVYFGLVEQFQEIFPATTSWCDGPSFLHQNRLMGGIFGGHKSMVNKWLNSFKEVTQRYIDCGLFIGKDQSIMNTACLRFEGLCHFISPSPSSTRDPWHVLKYHILDQKNK